MAGPWCTGGWVQDADGGPKGANAALRGTRPQCPLPCGLPVATACMHAALHAGLQQLRSLR